jgi:hypothetical protein
VAGQVHDLERTLLRGPLLQEVTAAAFLDDELHGQTRGGVQDRRFLCLKGQLLLAFRRSSHEHRREITVCGFQRHGVRRPPDAAVGHERLVRVCREEVARAYQGLPGHIEQRAGRCRPWVIHRKLKKPISCPCRPARSPAASIQPGPDLSTETEQQRCVA